MRLLIVCAVIALAGCGQGADAPKGAQPELAAPAQSESTARAFTPANDAATRASGPISVSVATQMSGGEVMQLTGQNGLSVEAELTGAADPSTTVQGNTLRSLLALDVQASQTLVYRVRKVEGALCADAPATHVVVWEPDGPGETVLKILPLRGGAPGEGGAQACGLLAYGRA